MTAIEKINSKLGRYPNLKYEINGSTIAVDPPEEDGFSVWLTERNPGFTVGFDGWHEEIDDEEEALSAFAFGLSDDCRLKVIQRGGTDCAWCVEGKNENGQWREDSTTGLLFTPFWKRRTVAYRQNRTITGSERHGSKTRCRVND